MALDITCPMCDESHDLSGVRDGDDITITCNACGQTWTRSVAPRCSRCDGDDLQTVPLAIVEKGRGTQLSVVGIRMVQLCRSCDGEAIDRWQANRPNPLLPDQLPTVDPPSGT